MRQRNMPRTTYLKLPLPQDNSRPMSCDGTLLNEEYFREVWELIELEAQKNEIKLRAEREIRHVYIDSLQEQIKKLSFFILATWVLVAFSTIYFSI